MRPQNKLQRNLIQKNKFKKRTWWSRSFFQRRFGGVLPEYMTPEYILKYIKEPYGFKSCSKPCSCSVCKRPRYNKKDRKTKDHDNYNTYTDFIVVDND